MHIASQNMELHQQRGLIPHLELGLIDNDGGALHVHIDNVVLSPLLLL